MLWSKAQQVATQALVQGDLLPISTEPRIIRQADVSYFLHLKNANSAHKFAPKPADFNPFLPYDASMFVAPAGDHHVCLLNKFPVLAPHLLICSNTFIRQTSALQFCDFQAWLYGFSQPDILGFYNGGKIAGASQPHRHLQLVKSALPLEALILSGELPFSHRLYRYDQLNPTTLLADYLQGLTQLGLYDPVDCQPYNLLLTQQWMLIIPRSTNNINGVFANGINYSGHFLLSNEAQMAWLADYGVLRFLSECAIADQNFQ